MFGTSRPTAEVLAQLQAVLQLLKAVTQTTLDSPFAVRARASEAVAARALPANVAPLLTEVDMTANQVQLSAFGVQRRKVRAIATTATRAIDTAKAVATGKVRGTWCSATPSTTQGR